MLELGFLLQDYHDLDTFLDLQGEIPGGLIQASPDWNFQDWDAWYLTRINLAEARSAGLISWLYESYCGIAGS